MLAQVIPLYGLGATDRLIPTKAQILPEPKQGNWYRIVKGQTWYGVAKQAYGKADVKKGLLTMNASTWNDHISRKKAGWESYNVKGLQSTPDYDVNNPRAPVMSGTAYPVAWIPPITGEEPEQVHEDPVVTIPTPIPPGGPSDDHILDLIRDYLDKNPPPPGATGPAGKAGKTGAPGAPGDPGPLGPPGGIGPAGKTGAKGAPGDPGPMGPPGPPATQGQIAALVKDYLEENPPSKGAPGDPGPMGPMGPAGQMGPAGTPGGSVSSGQIKSAVDEYMATNPVPTPSVDWSTVDDKIAAALKGFTGGGGDGKVNYVVLASAGLLGAAAMIAMSKRRTV